MDIIIGIICWSLPGLLGALAWIRHECQEMGYITLGEIVFVSIIAVVFGWITFAVGLVILITELPCWGRKIRCVRRDP